jgi:hypothetical protein
MSYALPWKCLSKAVNAEDKKYHRQDGNEHLGAAGKKKTTA